jgi:molybdate-binding protein
LRGPELGSHLEIALAVASGIAEVALSQRVSVLDLGLDFIPLLWEPYDIVLPGGALRPARPLFDALASSDLRTAIDGLGGYDLTEAGRLLSVA